MQKNIFPYQIRVIYNQIVIELREVSVEDLERQIDVSINTRSVMQIGIQTYTYPQLTISIQHLVIWGGTQIFAFDMLNEALTQLKWEDEVHYIFLLNDLWCIIGEISIVTIDSFSKKELNRYDHDEIILEVRVFDDLLEIVDLQEKHLRFKVSRQSIKLMKI